MLARVYGRLIHSISSLTTIYFCGVTSDERGEVGRLAGLAPALLVHVTGRVLMHDAVSGFPFRATAELFRSRSTLLPRRRLTL
jgi:hypothetical protein